VWIYTQSNITNKKIKFVLFEGWESTFEANDPFESYTNFHNNLKIAMIKVFPYISKNERKICKPHKKSLDDKWYMKEK
jgi:hypothetical protein